jgi:DNA-binding NtrC family response regulator
MSNKRILIVDDEGAIRDVLGDFFEGKGFEVFEAADGASALEIAREHPLDVVLTDLRMPGPDGFGVLKEMRRIRPETAVLIYTGYHSSDNAITALELGCDGYVSKPVKLEQLEYIIHQGLIKRKWDRKHLCF